MSKELKELRKICERIEETQKAFQARIIGKLNAICKSFGELDGFMRTEKKWTKK